MKFGLTLLLFFGWTLFSFAQVRTIKGIVTTSDTKETLPGATVLVKGTAAGAVTDIDGKYTITIKTEKTVLVFSYV
ncbi:MAG: carboxypeptidase-like regulatory domain-containing protein, partial [Bacteroidota bacterium]